MSASPRIKLAVIGGGPSAFYVASRLLQLLPPSHPLGSSLRIHIYDRLWAPHGLVRYGVAPDHPEVKVRIFNVSRLPSMVDLDLVFLFQRIVRINLTMQP